MMTTTTTTMQWWVQWVHGPVHRQRWWWQHHPVKCHTAPQVDNQLPLPSLMDVGTMLSPEQRRATALRGFVHDKVGSEHEWWCATNHPTHNQHTPRWAGSPQRPWPISSMPTAPTLANVNTHHPIHHPFIIKHHEQMTRMMTMRLKWPPQPNDDDATTLPPPLNGSRIHLPQQLYTTRFPQCECPTSSLTSPSKILFGNLHTSHA